VAPELGSVTTAEGLRVLPRYSFATSPEIDWLIVPSGEDYRTDINDEVLVGWIRRTGSQAAIVHSNCWGAFLLGAAGLLDAKQATTYPQSLEEFAQAFPRVKVRRDSLLVDDGGAVTSAGGVVSYDAALYIVEKHLGTDVAERVATGLVIDWKDRRADYESVSATPGS
jgi:transcriptional regulator GlxA family with amidase domain